MELLKPVELLTARPLELLHRKKEATMPNILPAKAEKELIELRVQVATADCVFKRIKKIIELQGLSGSEKLELIEDAVDAVL